MGGKTHNTATILDDCRDWVRRYVVIDDDQANVLAVWILHTWAIDAAEFTPYLHITAAEKECGKSRLLETLEPVVCRPCMNAGITAAALLRMLHAEKPTLLLDEVDAVFGINKEAAESIRGVLNAGYRRGGILQKCNAKSHELQKFNVFGPKAFAGIGKVPDTVASRSIVIEMRRRRSNEQIESLRFRDVEVAKKPLVSALGAWSQSGIIAELKEARPDLPSEFGDRQKDICEPLLAIADAAGGKWGQTIRKSLLTLFRSEISDDLSLGLTLLRDIRSVLRNSDRITSSTLVASLVVLEGSPWADWERGRTFTVHTLAKLLKSYHIHPRTIRIGDITQKGYLREWFQDSWSRYLPVLPEEPVTSVTSSVNVGNSADVHPSQFNPWSPDASQQKARQSSIVTAVTAVTAPLKQVKPDPFVEGSL